MKNIHFSTLLISIIILFSGFAHAQPGYYGSFKFKLFKDKKLVDLSDSNWKVLTNMDSNDYPTLSYKYPNYFVVNTNGGNGKENFYVAIIFKKDTMRIYTPSIDFRTVTLDSISFKKGTFKIPTYIYDLKDLVENTPDYYEYIPNIKGNWDLFLTKKEVYKCYIEKVADLDNISSPTSNSKNGNTMNWNSSTQFYFKKNFIIKHYDGYDYNNRRINKHFIYEIKNITDTTFWGSKINRYEILSLYSKENILYALIKKSYADFNKPTYGVYKLHFVEEDTITEKLSNLLTKQQIEEDYQSAIKLQGYGGALREKIMIEYNKITK